MLFFRPHHEKQHDRNKNDGKIEKILKDIVDSNIHAAMGKIVNVTAEESISASLFTRRLYTNLTIRWRKFYMEQV